MSSAHPRFVDVSRGRPRVSQCSDILNLVLAGGCPSVIAPVFFGGRLLALNKKSGGIRPIAIGFTLRRLESKRANSFGTSQLRSYFYPHQLGIGKPSGCEAAVHSARRYLEALPPDHVMVKLDFSNAFNSINRRDEFRSFMHTAGLPTVSLLVFRPVYRVVR